MHRTDRAGLPMIVLGHQSLGGYLDHSPYFGAVIGRCANRIANGRFTLDGVEYQLDCNDGVNHLHGGYRGFDKVLWDAVPFEHGGDMGIDLHARQPRRCGRLPGTVEVRVTYILTARGELSIQYAADHRSPDHRQSHPAQLLQPRRRAPATFSATSSR